MLKIVTLGALSLIALSGCVDPSREGANGNIFSSSDSLQALRDTKNDGSDFERSLRQGYLQFASREINEQWDFVDGDTFAKKGLEVGKVQNLMPEDPNDWPVAENVLPQLAEARQKLLGHLGAGARERAGNLAGTAQSLYDCWVEEEGEGYQPDDIAACRGRFWATLAELDSVMAEKQVTSAAPVQQAPMPVPARSFMINFDFDKSNIRASENAAIQQIAAAYAAQKNVSIQLVGFTDTAGGDNYNLTLSRERAVAVANALARLGVSREQIWMSWHGEDDLAVPTKDGVREERNRRVTIAMD